MKISKIDSSVLKLDHKIKSNSMKEIFWAKCGLLSEISLLANDRTEAGEKYTQAGVDYTDNQLRLLGLPNIKRIQYAGQEIEISYGYGTCNKTEKVKPTVEVLIASNDTDVVVSFRGTHNQAGWKINFQFDGTKTDIGECHAGWFRDMDAVYDLIIEYIKSLPNIKSMRLWVCGHSKGSAESQLFAVAVNGILPVEMWCGIGSPRPFKTDTAKYHTKIFEGRMFSCKNNNDIVAIVPPKPLGYDMCGQFLYIDADGGVHYGEPLWKQFLDGVKGFIKGVPNMFEGEFFEPGEDHCPHYYVNAFFKAAGCDRRYKRWDSKYL